MKKETVLRREVKKLAGKFPYESEKDGWKGKNYYRFAYDEVVFTVHEDDDFIKAWDTNKVHQVKIGITPEGGSFLNFTTREDLLDEARFDAELTAIKVGSVKPVASEAELNALG
jgi:hypothetical protein